MPLSPASARPGRASHVVWLLPLLCAAYAVWAGRDANWDLLNYHYYNVYAWLHGREQMDLAVGQLQTLFNPLLYLPLYLGMEHLEPRLYAALLGAVQGLNLVLVWGIARTAWPAGRTLERVGPLLVALTAGCGAGFLTQLGTSFGDTLLTLPLLGALRLLLAAGQGARRSTLLVFLAGVLGGIACGLKPLTGIYAIALAAALVSLPGTLRARGVRLSLLATGGLTGFAASGGWWCWHVWRLTGNPLFPYYNDIFQSPLYWNERFVFGFFLPKTFLEAVFYPWLWLVNPTRVSEMRFINLAIPGLLTLLAALAIARFLGLRPQGESTNATSIRALFVFWVAGYVLWLTQSSVYRFAVILEMLAPLLVVALLARWVSPELLRTRIVLALLPLMLLNYPANFGRFPYAGRFMQTTPVQVPPATMVAMAGWAPISYMVPAFPASTRFVRIQSNMNGFADHPNGLDAEARRRLEHHRGPILLLLSESEWHIAQPMLDHFGYRVDRALCQKVDGTLHGGGGIGDLELCPLHVGSASQPVRVGYQPARSPRDRPAGGPHVPAPILRAEYGRRHGMAPHHPARDASAPNKDEAVIPLETQGGRMTWSIAAHSPGRASAPLRYDLSPCLVVPSTSMLNFQSAGEPPNREGPPSTHRHARWRRLSSSQRYSGRRPLMLGKVLQHLQLVPWDPRAQRHVIQPRMDCLSCRRFLDVVLLPRSFAFLILTSSPLAPPRLSPLLAPPQQRDRRRQRDGSDGSSQILDNIPHGSGYAGLGKVSGSLPIRRRAWTWCAQSQRRRLDNN